MLSQDVSRHVCGWDGRHSGSGLTCFVMYVSRNKVSHAMPCILLSLMVILLVVLVALIRFARLRTCEMGGVVLFAVTAVRK